MSISRHIRRSGVLLPAIIATLIASYRLITVPPQLVKGQTEVYWPMANALLDGKGFSVCHPLYFPFCNDGDASAMREPLPVVLFAGVAAISGRSLQAALCLQGIAFVAVSLLLYRWAKRHRGERVALLAALGWCICLTAIRTIPQLSGDLIGAAFFLGAVDRFDRARASGRTMHWLVAGLLLGAAALCRSVLFFTLLPWLFFALHDQGRLAFDRVRLRNAAVFCTATLVVVAPWAIRNKAVFDHWWPGTSMNGYNLWRNSVQVADGRPPQYIGAPEAQRMIADFIARHPGLRGDENEGEMDAVYMAEGKAAILAHPGRYALLSLYRFIPLWTNIGVPEQYDWQVTVFDHAIAVQQIVLLVLLLAGWWVLRRHAHAWLVTIGLQVALYMAVVAQVRYLLPVLPLIIVLAAIGLDRWLPRRS